MTSAYLLAEAAVLLAIAGGWAGLRAIEDVDPDDVIEDVLESDRGGEN